MSKKKLGGKQTAPPDSSGDHNSCRDRLYALFGRGPGDPGDIAQYSSTSEKEAESIKNGLTNSIEQDCQNKKSANAYSEHHINEVARDLNSAVIDVTQKAVPSLLTPSRATKSPIHRHKRALSSFKIVDKHTADAVLLPPAVPYVSSSNENCDCPHSKSHTGAKASEARRLSQPPTINRKVLEEVQRLPSTTYASSEAMPRISEASGNNTLLTEKSPLLPSTPHVEPDLLAPAEGSHSLYSTPHATSIPLHGVLKVTASDKISADKKVRFAVASSSKSAKVDDTSGGSIDANQPVKQSVDDMKAAPESGLSPVIWDKESEPKIWLKDGKPTLFKPKKEPGYYTNPSWFRQYPEIFSNELRMDPHAPGYAESTTSTDGSEHYKTSAFDSNADFHMGTSLLMNTESNSEMNFNAGTSAPLAGSTITPGDSNTLPTPASHHPFVGQDFPEHTNTPPDFALTPRYRSQVKIEVGGRRFVTTFEVLEKSPWFRHLFSIDFRNWYHDGVFHIDNDGDLFAHILRYLRTGLYPLFWDSRKSFDYAMYAMIKQQAHHYMLYDLEAWIAAQKFRDVVETQVIHQKMIVPHNHEWIHKQRLMGNHSYVISGVVDHANSRDHLQRDTRNAGSAVVLFTTEKVVKVDMDQLRRV
ncbi:hypothetical protein LX36DRAFT_610952 [Colletotrichum falcatum]|nr:hypothetical protein LX36DRAFT_610952 [Colletotrichum falcatum]